MKLVLLLCLVLGLIATASCDKLGGAMKNVPGKVAVKVIDSQTNAGRGYVSVELTAADDGFDSYKMTTEDTGSTMFDGVTPGKYNVQVVDLAGGVFPTEPNTINVGPGRTITLDLVITPPAAPPAN